MEKLLSAKHWQIFMLIVLGLIIGNFKIENQPALTAVFTILGIFIYAIYPLAFGHSLQKYLPHKVELNHNLFLINFFVWIGAYSVIMIISDGHSMTFNGLIALPFIYVFYAFLHTIAFPAKTLKSIELGKEATIGEYLGYFFLIAFLPLGIWILQPRINKTIEREQLTNEETRTPNGD